MSFLDRVRECNHWNPAGFLPFQVTGQRVGWIRPVFASRLRQWPKVFLVSSEQVELAPGLVDFVERTRALGEVVQTLVEQGVISHRHGELYPVTETDRTQPLLLIDRAAAAWFGVRTFGQHLNGFVRDGKALSMWLGRRSADRRHFPLKLDNMVAGGLPYDLGLTDNLAKECWEEAGIERALADRARPVGLVSYQRETEPGLKPDTLFCYDLELPPGFVPRCTDGEVEEFLLKPLEEVGEIVGESTDFKPNCNLVVIDFLIRHGFIGPEHSDYIGLVSGLRGCL